MAALGASRGFEPNAVLSTACGAGDLLRYESWTRGHELGTVGNHSRDLRREVRESEELDRLGPCSPNRVVAHLVTPPCPP